IEPCVTSKRPPIDAPAPNRRSELFRVASFTSWRRPVSRPASNWSFAATCMERSGSQLRVIEGTSMTTDRELQENVLAALDWEAGVNAAHIGVSVNDGVVTLNGTVAALREKGAGRRGPPPHPIRAGGGKRHRGRCQRRRQTY